MTQTKKYDARVTPQGNTWTAEITRRVSSQRTVVSKSQDGFLNEADALAWAKTTLLEFSQTHADKNKRHARERAQKTPPHHAEEQPKKPRLT
ncbi:MAG TPA: DUF3622 domain-containing protein [Pseudomonadales bacterium]